ncbi:MAG TPA: GNAT family N-acetyltransferase [Candidatus Baltobacteraceae bacterium]|nr:GNAT family N-acetyltransferase [Candidatus Baltobacteraceae bacterium]
MSRPSAADFNLFFRGGIFGDYDIFTAQTYADFVWRNDIDLARAITAHNGRTLTGALALGIRADRAWFGLIGVHPEYRRAGLGRRLLAEALDAVRAAGVRRVELELSQRNRSALSMTRSFGFLEQGELLVWARSARPRAHGALPMHRLQERDVRAVAQMPSACWQREPRSVARAGSAALIETTGAYAFIQLRGEFANVIDAGARDLESARALVAELSARVPQDLTLNNEPATSVLSTALREHDWGIAERQYGMVLSA